MAGTLATIARMTPSATIGFALLLGCSDAPSTHDGSVVAWTADHDTVGDALMITPATALAGGQVYGRHRHQRPVDRTLRGVRAARRTSAG